MAPHSSTLAWKIPWTEEPGRLQTMGSRRVGHDRATSLSLFPFMHWRRKWHPTAVFLPGESQGRGSLVGCHLWGRTELDTTEVTQQQQQQQQQQQIPPVSGIIQLSFCDWLISLSLMPSKFNLLQHVLEFFSLSLNNIPLYVYTLFYFIHSSISRDLGCFFFRLL